MESFGYPRVRNSTAIRHFAFTAGKMKMSLAYLHRVGSTLLTLLARLQRIGGSEYRCGIDHIGHFRLHVYRLDGCGLRRYGHVYRVPVRGANRQRTVRRGSDSTNSRAGAFAASSPARVAGITYRFAPTIHFAQQALKISGALTLRPIQQSHKGIYEKYAHCATDRALTRIFCHDRNYARSIYFRRARRCCG